MPQRLLAATGQLTEQFVKLTDRQAVQIGQQIGAELRRAVELVGWIGSAGIGNHLPRLGPLVGAAGPVTAAGVVGLVALAALLAVLVAGVGALGAAGDRPGADAGLGRVAFCVQLHHHPGTQYRVVLGPTNPLGQLPIRPRPDGQLAVVERHKHRVKARRDRPAAALTGGLDGALADRLGIAGRHPKAVPVEGFAQRRPGSPKLLSGGVDAAQPLSQPEGPLGLGAIREEAAGLPAHPPLGLQGPMVAAGDRSTSVRRWVDA
jgi:hypothetical protein